MKLHGNRTAAALLTLTLVGFTVACGDDDDDSGAASPGKELTGPPVNIGYMTTENSPAGSFPDQREGAEAAVEHVNKDLGGLNGRPLEMESCVLNGSGEVSITCANTFVQQKKVAVAYGFDYGAAGSVPVFANAGIPYVSGVASEPILLTAPNSFVFTGGIAGAVPAVSRYVGEKLKAKKVAVLALDFPAGRAAVDAYAKPVLARFGITDVSAVYEAPTAADWTPALTKANEGNPDAIIVLAGGTACQKVMQGAVQLGIDPKKMVHVQTCLSQQSLDEGGAGADGIGAQSPFLAVTSDDPQVVEFRDAMERYSPDATLGPDSQIGFNSIMNLYTIMKKLPDITPQTIMAALKAAVNEPNFMAHTYTCDGQQLPGLSSICNGNERILTYSDGQFEDLNNSWVNGAEVLSGGG